MPSPAQERRKKLAYGMDLWRDLIRAKEPSGVCPRCRQRKWQECAHGFTQGAYPAMRLDVDNGIPLCRPCHRRVDSDHEAKFSLWTHYVGKSQYERLRLRAISRSKMDLGLTIMYLERLKEETL